MEAKFGIILPPVGKGMEFEEYVRDLLLYLQQFFFFLNKMCSKNVKLYLTGWVHRFHGSFQDMTCK